MRGKYSVHAYKEWPKGYKFDYNCYGQVAEPYTNEMIEAGVEYDTKTMFRDYDEEGFDKYGYSAFDLDGNFVDHGQGVDREGYAENDYMNLKDMSDDEIDVYYNSF